MRASVDCGLSNVTSSSWTVTDDSETEWLSGRRKPLQQTLHAGEAAHHSASGKINCKCQVQSQMHQSTQENTSISLPAHGTTDVQLQDRPGCGHACSYYAMPATTQQNRHERTGNIYITCIMHSTPAFQVKQTWVRQAAIWRVQSIARPQDMQLLCGTAVHGMGLVTGRQRGGYTCGRVEIRSTRLCMPMSCLKASPDRQCSFALSAKGPCHHPVKVCRTSHSNVTAV